ncbi:energy-coupling factor ABC transporter ATP-binding protein [Corynebacterium amycolatum]|uniref:energy-coupling factor ABC transporter ATP-binding protein n=1 Tax=Corynebacterium amycolatum TaxID=43765 RepID=UPI000E167895|nr:ABC transporter ATP-binding protein [Corynebacterium amycolatum]STB93629.1 ABC transporter ATP-binding protein [Corynebacterium amycolatum]
MPTITFDRAAANYSGRQILQPTTLTLTEKRIGIIGENGGGKSTLVRLINGLGAVTGGTVTYEGMNVAKQAKEIRKKVGFIFSDADNQIVMPTVAEDIAFSLRKRKLPKDQRNQLVQEALEHFGLRNHADTSPHLLSGGQKQLLALAAVLILNPTTIIADEPTTLLDLRNRLHIRNIFAQLEQQVIVVTHDLDFIVDFDRVIRVSAGEIVDDGEPKEVIDRYVRDMTRAGEGRL